MKRTFSILAAMLIMGTTAWAKTEIQVLPSRQIVFGRAFEVSYVVDGNGQQITLKNTDKFDIVAGPYRRVQNRTLREKGRLVTHTFTWYSYTMVPRESGEVKLPKAKIQLTKGSVTSPAAKVNVEEPRSFGPMGFEPMDFWGQDPFFDAPMPSCHQQQGNKRQHGNKRHHGTTAHPGKHHNHADCPHHEVHITTLTPEQIDTTGCEVTLCAPDSANMGDVFCVSYSIGAKADSIQLSDTTDFEIVGGPGYGTSWQSVWENGKQQNRYEQRYTYMVRARKAGELTLPKADIWIGNTRKQSSEKTISIQANEAK